MSTVTWIGSNTLLAGACRRTLLPACINSLGWQVLPVPGIPDHLGDQGNVYVGRMIGENQLSHFKEPKNYGKKDNWSLSKYMLFLSWWMWSLIKEWALVPGDAGTHLPCSQHPWPAESALVYGPHCQRCCPVATAVGWYFQSCSKDQAVCWLISLLLVRLQNRNL